MTKIRAALSADVPAPAARVYDIIADYVNGHPRIVPPEYFGRLTVLRGGRGAGTAIEFEMKAFGRVTLATAEVTEPRPGIELRETLDSGIVTTFLVEALGPDRSRVTIDTTYEKTGLRGILEGLMAPPYLRKVYAAELALLAREATTRPV
jgi:hypothetical protein